MAKITSIVKKELEATAERLKRLNMIATFSKRPSRVDSKKLEIAMIVLNVHCGEPCMKCEEYQRRNCLIKVRKAYTKDRYLQRDEQMVGTILDLIL